MIGLLQWKAPQPGIRQKTVTVEEQSILRMRFLQAEVLRGPRTPEAVLRRRTAQAMKRLRKRGVTRMVFPEDFAYHVQAERAGVRPVSTLALRRRLAADWVRGMLENRGVGPAGAKVAVTARQMTGELVRTVTELSLRHRYVLLDLPYGGEELCRQLRRDYGVSLLLGPDREQLASADVLVLFDEREDLPPHPAALPLWDERAALLPLALPPALEEQLPPGVCRGQLLAALAEAGALRPGQIAAVSGAVPA